MTADQVVRFGTRGSALARAQADLVIRRLHELHPEVRCEVVIIQTEGDRDKETPLTVIGGRGVFTNALQEALRRGEIDVAVHSAKDLPTEEAPGLKIAAFLERADPRDVFVSRHGKPLAELAPNPVIGTSSRRRQVQVLKLRPDAQLVDLRGNIDTRLRKAFETELDGIVLAAAGIERMGWLDQITEYLSLEIAVPSPGQGALAVEVRAGDIESTVLIEALDDPSTSCCVKVERSFLRGTGGGCTSPVGAHATVEGDLIRIRAMLGSANLATAEWIDERLATVLPEVAAAELARKVLAQVESKTLVTSGKGRGRRTIDGKQILVTRPSADDRLASELRKMGAIVLAAPAIRIEPVASHILEARIGALGHQRFDWVVFTSANAVDAFLKHAVSVSLIGGAFVAAVGQATRERLRERGIDVSLVPSAYTGETLVAEMTKQDLAEKRVLFPHGNRARQTVPDGLRAAGAVVELLKVYETVPERHLEPDLMQALTQNAVDAVVFCSPSSVDAITAALGDQVNVLQRTVIACIGPTTAEAAQGAGLNVAIVPENAGIEALLRELTNFFGRDQAVLTGSGRGREGGPVS